MEQNQSFIDAEYCIDQYFEKHIISHLDFLSECRTASLASSEMSGFGVRNAFFPSEDYATDVTLSFPANDIEKMCAEIVRDKGLRHDVDVLAATWRTAAVERVGMERYKALSEQLGMDLATAYVNHRLMMRMVDYEVAKNPIQDSADYIFDEARRSSILSYLSPDTSALQQYIDKKIIEQYDPGLLERGTGKALGSLTDVVITSPMMATSSWATLGKFVAFDICAGLVVDTLASDVSDDMEDVGQIVSTAIFGEGNALAACQQQCSTVNPYSSPTVKGANEQLSKKIVRNSSYNLLFSQKNTFNMDMPELPKIPDYISQLRQSEEMHFDICDKFPVDDSQAAYHPATTTVQAEQNITPQQPTNSQSVTGWNGLFDTLGLSGFGDVGKNLGYVLAMLPDMLVGMFTGKTRNLKFGDNMLPLAAIIAGMFVKNPLLKMLLVGLGGANLLNKAGHEALENRDGVKTTSARPYRTYNDEPLDLRIFQPAMRGNTLVATIDGTPCIITVNDEVVDAYYQGKLPLNTLANAVLRKYDAQQQALQENYDRQMNQEQSINRSLGIK